MKQVRVGTGSSNETGEGGYREQQLFNNKKLLTPEITLVTSIT